MTPEKIFLTKHSWKYRIFVSLLISVFSISITSLAELLHLEHFVFVNFASVVLVAIYSGLAPAVISAVVNALAVDYFAVIPIHSIELNNPENIIRAVLFVTTAVIVSWLISNLRDSYGRLLVSVREANSIRRKKEEVLATVSHDLGSSITGVLMASKAIMNRLSEDGGREEVLELSTSIHETAESMTGIIRDLLDSSRMEAGIFKLNPKEIEVRGLIRTALSTLPVRNEEREIKIDCRIKPEEAILCDGTKISRVLSNLIGNAMKYSPTQAPVEVGAKRENGHYLFWVKDEGPGISVEDFPHLFTKYWRSNSTEAPGTGLGLYIAKGIVEAHQGRMHVDTVVGRGSTFSFTLPALSKA